MSGEMFVHLEHGHLVRAEDFRELVVRQDLAAVLRVLQVVRAGCTPRFLLTTSPRGRGLVPTTAASSSDGCSGFCSAFGLPSLALLFDVLVGIDLLHRSGAAHNVPPCLCINASIAAATRAAPCSSGVNAGVDI